MTKALAMLCLAGACASAQAAKTTQQALDEQFVLTYAVAISAPAMVQACNAINPYDAARFEFMLQRWFEMNEQRVAVSRERTRDIAQREHKDAEAELGAQRDRLVAELQGAEPELAMRRCGHLLDYLSEGLN